VSFPSMIRLLLVVVLIGLCIYYHDKQALRI
jgi:hypothetical protein